MKLHAGIEAVIREVESNALPLPVAALYEEAARAEVAGNFDAAADFELAAMELYILLKDRMVNHTEEVKNA